MLDKQGVYDCLHDHHIDFEVTDHAPLFSMDDKPDVELPYPEWDAKNLFIRDHKREHYYLITVRGSKRVDLKQFRKDHNLKKISFGSEEELWEILKIKPGHVSPFCLLMIKNTEYIIILMRIIRIISLVSTQIKMMRPCGYKEKTLLSL